MEPKLKFGWLEAKGRSLAVGESFSTLLCLGYSRALMDEILHVLALRSGRHFQTTDCGMRYTVTRIA